MVTSNETTHGSARFPIGLACAVFAAIAVYFLWDEHEAHLRGALPYVLLLACPVMHLFLHRSHSDPSSPHQAHGSQAHTDRRAT